MEIPESNYDLFALCLWAQVRDEAEETLLKALHRDAVISENMRAFWTEQRCGAEV